MIQRQWPAATIVVTKDGHSFTYPETPFVVLDTGECFLYGGNGQVAAQMHATTEQEIDTKHVVYYLDLAVDGGEKWDVTRAGCNCAGSGV